MASAPSTVVEELKTVMKRGDKYQNVVFINCNSKNWYIQTYLLKKIFLEGS